MLKFITRDGSSPQGKARVYFCCHPEDFERYFKPVTDEIFKYQNCAIYYEADPDAPYDAQEVFSDHNLGRMQLFVMPVTSKLLYQKSRAMDVEFPLTQKEHIPVLPLMQEPNLEGVFNEKCGNLQFLDKYKQDATSIKYEEKLEKYLSGVLIGDEMAEKIRNAFDAYVFLSYRKKDRKHAQELMRLIHKNDFCRDIAIWYDEFLNPGENFNSAIEEALKKSKLFALAVTPNLVNETNYIMTNEYPLAKEAGKRIIPAELEKTDRKLLENKFDGIPLCIDAHNEPELSRELLDALKGLAIRENDTPEHNFFIGLAYLDGIDVERDNERALNLITSSAEADLPEAIKKLVTIYRSGKGAALDFKAAIEWQKRLVENYKKASEKDGSEEREYKYAVSIFELGLYNQELNMFSEAIKDYLSAIEICKRLSKQNPETYEVSGLAAIYNNLGISYNNKQRFKEAEEAYLTALEIFKRLSASYPETYESYLAMSYSNLGALYKETQRINEAEEAYLTALEIRKRLSKKNPEAYEPDLAMSYSNLGALYKVAQRFNEAEGICFFGLEINKRLSKKNPEEYEPGLATSYSVLGSLYSVTWRFSEAEEAYLTALEIRKRLSKKNPEVYEPDLAMSYNNLGSLYSYTKRFKEAEEVFLFAIELEKRLSRKNPEAFETDLAIDYNNLGVVYRYTRRLIEAKEVLERAKDLFQKHKSCAQQYEKVMQLLKDVEADFQGS